MAVTGSGKRNWGTIKPNEAIGALSESVKLGEAEPNMLIMGFRGSGVGMDAQNGTRCAAGRAVALSLHCVGVRSGIQPRGLQEGCLRILFGSRGSMVRLSNSGHRCSIWWTQGDLEIGTYKRRIRGGLPHRSRVAFPRKSFWRVRI